jgi:hypothetical protein
MAYCMARVQWAIPIPISIRLHFCSTTAQVRPQQVGHVQRIQAILPLAQPRMEAVKGDRAALRHGL